MSRESIEKVKDKEKSKRIIIWNIGMFEGKNFEK